MGKHDRVENGLDLDEGAPASNSKIPLPLKVFGGVRPFLCGTGESRRAVCRRLWLPRTKSAEIVLQDLCADEPEFS